MKETCSLKSPLSRAAITGTHSHLLRLEACIYCQAL